MKSIKRVYVLCSLDEDTFMIFGTEGRANEFIKEFNYSTENRNMFPKSTKDSLYIMKRILF